MSRSIDIGYRPENGGALVPIELPAPYYLFGTQRLSMEFWSLPRLREIGLTRLTDLGVTDPVYFVGWEDMAELEREIALLQQHLRSIAFYPEPLAGWLSHLVYCHGLLSLVTPEGSAPELCIG
ncbi:hypothetical protein R5W24_005931, partial [Gemmata sp. JC717]|uniref:hypothetical protein n=1 Tax=Gemmata algarum TaxID=2975278 RepID=UPI0021BAE4A4